VNLYVVSFVLYSFVGWVWESIYCTIKTKQWANRGFLYGPICPIYGCGGVICLAVTQLTDAGLIAALSWLQIMIAGFFVSMILEYPTSWALEKLFQARWWDYSDIPLNLHGRTSVPTSIAFGAAAILMMKVLLPFFNRQLSAAPAWCMNLSALIFTGVLCSDLTLTVSAITNFQKRVAEAEDSFRIYMTDTVDQAFALHDRLHQMAVKRIVAFRLPKQRAEAVRKLREEKFAELTEKYFASSRFRMMGQYIQHGKTTTLEHAENVAWVSFLVNEKMHLNADEKELVESAMLHDFYLYDWHDGDPSRKRHGFTHAELAGNNAKKEFNVSDKTQKAIKSHMWPLNITKVPRSREAVILCIVDKYCAMVEMLRGAKGR